MQLLNQLSDRPYTMHWDWSHYGWDVYEEGVAVLSVHPAVDVSSKYVSQSSSKEYWKSRKIIRVGVDLKDEIVDVFSCHTGWYHDKDEPFARQCESLGAFVQERPNRSLIMGDFNNAAGTPGYDLLVDRFIDLFPLGSNQAGNTFRGGIAGWEGNDAGKRIDYVLTDRGVSSVKAGVVFESEPVSDHFGVMMELEW
jgi:maltose 6'-phosphate phosphatase